MEADSPLCYFVPSCSWFSTKKHFSVFRNNLKENSALTNWYLWNLVFLVIFAFIMTSCLYLWRIEYSLYCGAQGTPKLLLFGLFMLASPCTGLWPSGREVGCASSDLWRVTGEARSLMVGFKQQWDSWESGWCLCLPCPSAAAGSPHRFLSLSKGSIAVL